MGSVTFYTTPKAGISLVSIIELSNFRQFVFDICAGFLCSSTMTLRNHPLMISHGVPNWPPVWTKRAKKDKKFIMGEVGILRHVLFYGPSSYKCYLVIDYEREYYVATLLFDDVAFCYQITDLFRKHVGRQIEEIGDLDLSHTL